MISIVMTSYLRLRYTEQSIKYLRERTTSPFRLIVVDNGSDQPTQNALYNAKKAGFIDELVLLKDNYGIHAAKNIGLSLVHGHDFYVDTDNDIFVPHLSPDWLTRLYEIMCKHPDFGAIACQPQTFIGGIGKGWQDEEVFETGHVGAVMRMMRVDAVKKAGGWEKTWDAKRNHEEHYICGKLKEQGLRVGYAQDLICFHPFHSEGTDRWGYPAHMKPEDHGHRDVHIPESVGDINRYNPFTWKEL